MFDWLLTCFTGRAKVASNKMTDTELWERLRHKIDRSSQDDPLLGARLGAKQITHNLRCSMATECGVHIESFLCALASCAGYSCQASLRAKARSHGLDETAYFVRVEGEDGTAYFFGDALNRPLAESRYSVWSLAAGASQAAGCTEVLDMQDIFRHVAHTVGTPEFGLPRLPPEHSVSGKPLHFLEDLWPQILPLMLKFCPDPDHWPILMGLGIHDMIVEAKDVLDPCIALKIVMESAIPMSKVDLRTA